MSGSVSCACVPNCHQTFAIPQNLCTVGQAAFWYEEGISKLVSRYKRLNVQGDYVEKKVKVCDKTCIFCFFPITNKYLCMARRSLLSERPSYICAPRIFMKYVWYFSWIHLAVLAAYGLMPRKEGLWIDLPALSPSSWNNSFISIQPSNHSVHISVSCDNHAIRSTSDNTALVATGQAVRSGTQH